MAQPRILSSIKEIKALEASVRQAAEVTWSSLAKLLVEDIDALSILRRIRFEKIGRHPTQDRDLNLTEQLNQTFTILVTLRAARWLANRHGIGDGIRVSLGTERGFDLQSVKPNRFVGEAFAATHPESNKKLAKELDRLERAVQFRHRYVFLQCPGVMAGRRKVLERPGSRVEVWSFRT